MSGSQLTLEVDRCRGQYQVSIALTDDRGAGGGYRLYGPKYDGTSSPVLKVRLSALERQKLREYLDKADAADEATGLNGPES